MTVVGPIVAAVFYTDDVFDKIGQDKMKSQPSALFDMW